MTSCLLWTSLALWSVLPLCGASTDVDTISVHVDSVPAGNGAVDFRAVIKRLGGVDVRGNPGHEYEMAEATDPTDRSKTLQLFLDPTSGVSLTRSYQHNFWVCGNIAPSCAAFTLISQPYGFFPDQFVATGFKIVYNDRTYDGKNLRLPLHSFEETPGLALSEPSDKTIVEVRLGGETQIPISLSNPLHGSPFIVDHSADVAAKENDLWSSPLRAALVNPKISEGASTHVFTLTVRPNILSALAASMMPIPEGASHTKLVIPVRYHADSGGFQRVHEFTVAIRFVPSPWSLLGISVLGSWLGVLFCFVLPGQTKMKVSWDIFVAAAVCGVVAEVLSILFVAAGSKIVLFKMEINPSQILTVFLIGFGSGLLVVWRSDLIREWVSRAASALAGC